MSLGMTRYEAGMPGLGKSVQFRRGSGRTAIERHRELACISHHLTDETRDKTGKQSAEPKQ